MFPVIMKSKTGLVVLFTTYQHDSTYEGVVIVGDSCWEAGEISRLWDIREFTRYDGDVIINNEGLIRDI